jgi:hypothetical protein
LSVIEVITKINVSLAPVNLIYEPTESVFSSVETLFPLESISDIRIEVEPDISQSPL